MNHGKLQEQILRKKEKTARIRNHHQPCLKPQEQPGMIYFGDAKFIN